MTNAGSKDTPICLDEDDDDNEVQLVQRPQQQQQPAPSLNLSIEERRALNQQREARQAKRMREAAGGNSDEREERPAQRPRVAAAAPAQPALPRPRPAAAAAVATSSSSSSAAPAPTAQSDTGRPLSPLQASQRFWKGTVRRSWNGYVGTGLKFGEMLLPSTSRDKAGMQHALLVNFSPDPDWLYPMFPRGLAVTFVHQYAEGTRAERVQTGSFPGWDVVLPPRAREGEKYGTQHVKMLALFYADRLRLCILTGNMLALDWEHIENVAYIQDFHRLENSKKSFVPSDAYIQLSMMFTSLGLTQAQDRAFAELSRYDLAQFGGDSGARLVVSMPGAGGKSVEGWESIEKVGLGRLKRVVDDMRVKAVRGGLELSAQGSSLGRDSNIRWLTQLHVIASGLSRGLVPLPGGKWKPIPALTSALQRPAPAATASNASASTSFPPSGCPPVRVLFPSVSQVLNNLAGPQTGGAFFAKQVHIDYGGYEQLLHQPVSERGKLLMHAKVILALPKGAEFARGAAGGGVGRRLDEPAEKREEKGKEKQKDDEKPCGWLYVGSHNLTRSAWGNLSGTTDDPKLTLCNNHELGIVFPIRDADLRAGATSMARDALVFVNPPPRYGAQDKLWDLESYKALAGI